jgi:nucleotide-binding universal stress UspA family protein
VEARGGPQWIVGMLQRTTQRLEAEGLKVQSSVEYGKPAEEILRVAAAINTDMVVMATHGRTGLERMWFGSVAMEVMRRLDRAVLLVRPPSRAQPEQQVPASS